MPDTRSEIDNGSVGDSSWRPRWWPRFQRIYRGAPDEMNRDWLREDEVKSLLQESSKGYQTTFFEKEGVWRSNRGYFKLWQDLEGNKAIVFGFHHSDLETFQENAAHFSGGFHEALKSTKGVHPVKFWGPEDTPKLYDILHAIDVYSDRMRRAIANLAVLYVTDPKKGIRRSGSVAYKDHVEEGHENLPPDQQKVRDIAFYSNILDTGSLVNPFGETWIERLLKEFKGGIGLLNLAARRASTKGNGKRKLRERFRRTEPIPHNSVSRKEADAHAYIHFLTASNRFLRGRDPVSEKDKQFNKARYRFDRFWQLMYAAYKGGKNRFKDFSFDRMPQLIGTASGVFSIVAGVIGVLTFGVAGLAIVAFRAFSTMVQVMGLVKKRAINREDLIDLRDPLVQRFSDNAERISDFALLERKLKKDEFAKGTFINQPTFDAVPPYGIRTMPSFDEWPADLLETSLQERGGSEIDYYLPAGYKSAAPKKAVEAIKIKRQDGIVAIKFRNENRVWGIYAGQPLNPVLPPPPSALTKLLDPEDFDGASVVEITNKRGAKKPDIRHIPLEEAEREFQQRFGRPLMEDVFLCIDLNPHQPRRQPRVKKMVVAPPIVPEAEEVPVMAVTPSARLLRGFRNAMDCVTTRIQASRPAVVMRNAYRRLRRHDAA